MTGSSNPTSVLKIVAWTLLGFCVVYFGLAWGGGAAPAAVFYFYITLSSGLTLLYIDWRIQKRPKEPPSPPTPMLPGSSSSSSSVPTSGTLTPVFQWTGVPAVDRYALYVKSGSVDSSATVYRNETISGRSTSVYLRSGVLQDSRMYHWFMRAHNRAGWSDFSSTLHFQTPRATRPGVRVLNDRYEITTQKWKTGGMAFIHLARDEQSNSQCVIKTPRDDTEHARKLNIEKLEKEADYLKNWGHPHIVKFIDSFTEDGKLYLVEQHIEGQNLLEAFESVAAEETRVIRWGEKILNALEYIHRSGFIHRDINPGNIVLRSRDHSIVLIDFGTIQYSGYSSDTVIFKPGFEVSEVKARGYADERSDIYGVGGTLYYLLTCERPGSIGNRDPADILVNRGVSDRTAKCVKQALSLEPSFRFQSATAMRQALLGGSDANRL